MKYITTTCKYCRNIATTIRFIDSTVEHICDSRACDFKSKTKHGCIGSINKGLGEK